MAWRCLSASGHRPQFECGNAEGNVDRNRTFQRDGLQGKRAPRTPDQDVCADAKAEARASLVRSLREPQAPAAQSASPSLGATSGTCQKCRKPLDAALATAGVHIGCALGLR